MRPRADRTLALDLDEVAFRLLPTEDPDRARREQAEAERLAGEKARRDRAAQVTLPLDR